MTFQKKSLAIACSLALACMGSAHADQLSDMQTKLDALTKQIQELQAQIGAVQKKQEQVATPPRHQHETRKRSDIPGGRR